MKLSLHIHNQLIDLSQPRIMAIINFSPDSFYTSCDVFDEKKMLLQVEQALADGADILDLGACSTRPESTPINALSESSLLCQGLELIRYHWPNVPISIDTFRSEIAEQAIARGADMINDISGINANPNIWKLAADKHIPYVLTHSHTITDTSAMTEILNFLQQYCDLLHSLGIADVLVDPGFGFGKTIEQNYQILNHLDVLENLHAPILIGVSRKSMLYRPLNLSPQDVLSATIAANTLALERGANILRVHDVEAAKQAITVFQLTHRS